MAWTKLDDRFHSHPKVLGLSPHAFRLYVLTLNWSVAHLTDGHVPNVVIDAFGASRSTRKWRDELHTVGLWDGGENGIEIHDFVEYQPTRESEKARKANDRERQQRHRARRDGRDVTRDTTRDVTRESRTPDPTRPITSPNGDGATPKSDGLFEAVYGAVHGEPYRPGTAMTKTERGRINAAVKELREVGAAPDDVAAFAGRYVAEWPNVELSPQAITANWSRFKAGRKDRCGHRWNDGRTAWSATTRGGVDIVRCDKCGEVRDDD